MRLEIQLDEKDCGLVVLQSFYKHFYRKWIDINLLKQHIEYSQNGISLYNLKNLASKIGLECEILEGDFVSFTKLNIDKPIFVLTKESNYFHYIIIEEKDSKYIYALDPAKGKRKILLTEFENLYLNIIVYVKATNQITISTNNSNKLNIYEGNILNLIVINVLSIVFQAFLFASSFLMKYIIDNVIVPKNILLLNYYIILFLWIFVLRVLSNFFKTLLQQKLYLILQQKITNLFVQKTLNSQIKEFEKISKSDYMQRFYSIQAIAMFYSNFIPLLFSGTTIFFASGITIFLIDWSLALFSYFIVFINFLGIFIFKKITNKHFPTLIKNSVLMYEKNLEIFLNNINLKNPIYKESMQQKINDLTRKNYLDSFLMWKIINFKSVFTTFLNVLMQILIVYIATKSILNNSMQIGNLLLFNSSLTFMISPSDEILEVFSNWKINKQNISRLNYILFINIEDADNKSKIGKIKTIQFKNFSFGYNANNIIKNLNLIINKNTHLVGKNGCGKTTIFKLIYGLYKNFDGKLFINDIDILNIDLSSLREKIFMCWNNCLPNGNLINLITFQDPNLINIFKQNIDKYQLNKFIESFSLDWNYKIEDNGIYLSSGQKQFINLLRLFCSQYDLIMLDEAFENIQNSVLNNLYAKILDFQKDALFVEISHTKRYIYNKNSFNFFVDKTN